MVGKRCRKQPSKGTGDSHVRQRAQARGRPSREICEITLPESEPGWSGIGISAVCANDHTSRCPSGVLGAAAVAKATPCLFLRRRPRVAIFADNTRSFPDIVHIPSLRHRRTYKQPFSAPQACSIPLPRPPAHLSRLPLFLALAYGFY